MSIGRTGWDRDTTLTFVRRWQLEMARNDPVAWPSAGGDLRSYLIQRVFEVVNQASKIGSAGWEFRAALATDCVLGAVWADGVSSSSQSQALSVAGCQPGGHREQWWPCLVLQKPGDTRGVLPFYCPALAWQRARPWTVHVSRVRMLMLDDVSGADDESRACMLDDVSGAIRVRKLYDPSGAADEEAVSCDDSWECDDEKAASLVRSFCMLDKVSGADDEEAASCGDSCDDEKAVSLVRAYCMLDTASAASGADDEKAVSASGADDEKAVSRDDEKAEKAVSRDDEKAVSLVRVARRWQRGR
jgi:hypothetical protein